MNTGLVDKLCCCFLSVQGPVDENPSIASFLQNATAVLHGMCQLCWAVSGRWVHCLCQLRQGFLLRLPARAGPLWDTQGQKWCWRVPLLSLLPATCNELPAPSLLLISHLSELQTLPPLLIIPHRLLSLIVWGVQSQGLQEVFYYPLKSTVNWFVSMICLESSLIQLLFFKLPLPVRKFYFP